MMRLHRRHISAIFAGALLCVGCSGPSAPAVPRRTAYPRIEPYDSAYTAIEGIPLRIMANSGAPTSAEKRPDGSVWVNISYPRYDATVYCTLTPVDAGTVAEVIDNRAERLHRNLGAARPEFLEFGNASGYNATVVLTPSATSTPVQFMAVSADSPRWVVSGSAFFDHATVSTSVDSIMPMIDVLRRDVVYLLDNLGDR